MKKLPKVSLYVHIPFCIKKCPYCDFHSLKKKYIPEEKYIYHLIQDLKESIHLIKHRKIQTIFIGGGTPSLFSAKNINFLIKEIKNNIKVVENPEITIEANPTTIENKKFLEYKQAGINRLSIGIQSFKKSSLDYLNREYSTKNILNSIKIAKLANFDNINFDLMHSLPHQTLNMAISDLKKAISFNPSHISWYQLSIEPKTKFFYTKHKFPSEKTIFNIFKKGEEILISSGYKKYEISSYFKKNPCLHNLNYWNFGDYLGIGSGAHSKITQINGKIIRISKTKKVSNFMKGLYIEEKKNISKKDIILEYFMNVLRLIKPIKKKDFHRKTGINQKYLYPFIKKAINSKYLIEDSKYWKTTKKGKNFLNDLLEEFM
ncbi:radical SAM family heme chaperone HemW [Buchnera aphidicola (Mindarus keteleerifoliae)]|uniref:radical SAM family heme chaperone HemW n=1 Tax=Buchnera aphidicola TaxID=9 RepID=UPI0031B6AAB0